MAPLKSINFSLIWWAGSPWFSGFVFYRTSWENWSIMWSFLFSLSALIFFPLLYHNLIYVLIIRHHSVNFFPLPPINLFPPPCYLWFYWSFIEIHVTDEKNYWRTSTSVSDRWEWVPRLGIQLSSPALHRTSVARIQSHKQKNIHRISKEKNRAWQM